MNYYYPMNKKKSLVMHINGVPITHNSRYVVTFFYGSNVVVQILLDHAVIMCVMNYCCILINISTN